MHGVDHQLPHLYGGLQVAAAVGGAGPQAM